MRVASKIAIRTFSTWTGKECPPELCLVDDNGDVMASIEMKELAKALAPYLKLSITTEEEPV
jgi:hypothetical protein